MTEIEAAVCDANGRRRFQFHQSAAMGHLTDDGAFEVSTVTLDHFVFETGVTPPNSIKIDVEGAEFSVLQGAREVLAQNRPALLLATTGKLCGLNVLNC